MSEQEQIDSLQAEVRRLRKVVKQYHYDIEKLFIYLGRESTISSKFTSVELLRLWIMAQIAAILE